MDVGKEVYEVFKSQGRPYGPQKDSDEDEGRKSRKCAQEKVYLLSQKLLCKACLALGKVTLDRVGLSHDSTVCGRVLKMMGYNAKVAEYYTALCIKK